MNALVTARFEQAELTRLERHVGAVRRAGYGVTGQRLAPRELAGFLADVDVLVVEYEEVTRDVLEAAERLRLLGCCRNEPEATVDVAAASELAIPVLFTPGRNAVSVAEYTLGLMLAVARHIAEAHHLLRHTTDLSAETGHAPGAPPAEWSLEPGAPFARFHGPELQGRTLGLVGFGAAGREIGRRCRALGMDVVAFDPHVRAAVLEREGVRGAPLLETAAAADFLVLAAKVTPDSRGIVSAKVIAAMKPTAFFVNTARAALADYDALADALRAGRIAGAALDVYPTEPLPRGSPLLALDNAVLSPHLAGASHDVPGHHSRQLTDDLLRALRGERPLHLAQPAVWERRR